MNDVDDRLAEDEFYFEDDREYEDYPGCGASSPPVLDPVSLLHPDRLSGGYDGTWTRYDSFRVESRPDDSCPGLAFINDRRVPIHRRTDLYEYANGLTSLPHRRRWPLPFMNERCPYCRHVLGVHQVADGESRWDDEDEENFDEEMDEFARVWALEYCRNCRYWRWHDFDVFSSFAGVEHSYRGALSKIREFDSVLPDGFTQEVARWIRAREKSWHTIHPTSMEKLVADVISSVYQPAEAIHVGKPHDGGTDVVFVDTSERKWLIQVKRRENPTPGEPVKSVRNLLGTLFLEDSTYGMIVSTADHFTQYAHAAAGRAGEKGTLVKLVNRSKLDRMLDSVLPEKPWLELLQRDYPAIAPDFEAVMGTPEIDPDPLDLF